MRSGMKRLLVLLGVLAMLAAACNGDNGDGNGGAAGNLEGETVRVMAVWSGTEQERFEAVLEAFEEETGATAEYVPAGSDDIAAVLGPAIEGGDPPDIAMLPNPGLLQDLAEQGDLQDVEDVVGDTVDENYAPVWRELATVDDTLHGVFFKASNKSTVWYNTHVFEDAGAEEPETWEDFISTAQTITDSGTPGVSIGGGDGWTLTDWFENVYIRVAGPEKYDQLTNHEIPWTDQSVKDTLSTLAELWSKDNLIAGGADGALQTDFNESVTQVWADPPKAGMVYEGDFVAGIAEGDAGATIGEDARFFNFPSVNDSEPAVVGGGDVAVLLKDSEAGKALINFLATPEAAEVWAELGGFTSPNQEVDLSVYPNDVIRRSAQALTEAETFRFDLSDLTPAEFGGTAGQGMWKILQDFLADPSDVDGTAQALEDAAAAAYDE